MSEYPASRQALGWVAVILAVGMATALNAITFAVLYDAIRSEGPASCRERNAGVDRLGRRHHRRPRRLHRLHANGRRTSDETLDHRAGRTTMPSVSVPLKAPPAGTSSCASAARSGARRQQQAQPAFQSHRVLHPRRHTVPDQRPARHGQALPRSSSSRCEPSSASATSSSGYRHELYNAPSAALATPSTSMSRASNQWPPTFASRRHPGPVGSGSQTDRNSEGRRQRRRRPLRPQRLRPRRQPRLQSDWSG